MAVNNNNNNNNKNNNNNNNNEIEKVDHKMRKLLTTEEIHHPKADVSRLYIKRRSGGHGLVELESAYNAAIVGLSKYIKQGKDRLTRLVHMTPGKPNTLYKKKLT
jgi:hypothetical protein